MHLKLVETHSTATQLTLVILIAYRNIHMDISNDSIYPYEYYGLESDIHSQFENWSAVADQAPQWGKGKIMPSIIFNDVIRRIGIASVLAMSPLAANAANINLAVANAFYGDGNSGGGTSPIADIIAAFQAANPGDTVTIVDQGQPPTLKAQITGGNGLDVDLFLSADTTQPNDLYNNHNMLVVGMPFNYASGALAFWSNTSGVDVTCGTGSCGYNSSTYPDVAIGKYSTNPVPYGTAAKTLLEGRYALSPLASYVTEYNNLDLVYNAIDSATKKAGFVPLLRVCDTTAGTWPNKGSALVYPPTDTSVSPSIYNYSPIFQAGIKIARSRTTPEDTVLTNFVAYLQDYTVSPSKSQMVQTLEQYCYLIP